MFFSKKISKRISLKVETIHFKNFILEHFKAWKDFQFRTAFLNFKFFKDFNLKSLSLKFKS